MRLKRNQILLFVGIAAMALVNKSSAAPGAVDPLVAPRFEIPGKASALAVQADGKWIVGGNFTAMNGVERGKIARLHPDGSLDTSFDPGPKSPDIYDRSEIYTLSMQGSKVLAGGLLSYLAGQPASAVVRLNADGTRDPTFTPPTFGGGSDPQAWVATDRGDGKILVAGLFSSVGGEPRANLVKLNSNGSIDSSFNPSLNAMVYAAVPVTGDRWLIAGAFTTVSGQARTGIARLLATGNIDPSFVAVPLATGSVVESLEMQADGKIVFTGRQGSNCFVGRALADGGADSGFTAGAVPGFYPDAVVLPDGDLMIDGPNGATEGWSTFQLTRLQPGGAISPISQPSGLGLSSDLLACPDGSVIVTGQFSNFGNELRFSLARILSGGTVDPAFHPDATDPAEVRRIVPLSGGRWLVAGTFSGAIDGVQRAPHFGVSRLTSALAVDGGFTQVFSSSMLTNSAAVEDGQGRLLIGGTSNISNSPRRLNRLGVDGGIDPAFNVQLASGNVIADLAVQSDGFILAAGTISQANGRSQRNVIRVSSAGAVDTTFTPPVTSALNDLALEKGGKILVAGSTSLKRLQPSGLEDSSFNQALPVTGNFQAVASLPGRRVLVAGDFTALNGKPAGRIARLDALGNPDAGFQPGTGANGIIRSLQVRSDGDLFIAGDFTSYNGQSRIGIAQLSPDGALRPAFDPGTGFNGTVYTLALTADGSVLAGGAFTEAGGLKRSGFARLQAAPLQAIAPAPDSPGKLIVTSISSQQVLMLWADSQNESGYIVERRESNTTDWLTLGHLVAGTTHFEDRTVVPGKQYEYRVLAWNSSGDAPLATAPPVTAPGRDGLAGAPFAGNGLDLWRNGEVTAVVRQADGMLIIAGMFTHLNGIPCGSLARLHPDGSLDPSFAPPANLTWSALALGIQSNGRIIAVGSGGITGLKPDGSLDATFTPASNISTVRALVVLPDDKLLVGGLFPGSRPNLARLQSNGTIDTTFADPGVDGIVNCLAVQPDGKVLASGYFNRVDFGYVTSVARFNTNGTRDTNFAMVPFKLGASNSGSGSAIALQSDGKILVGGSFDSVNNVARNNLVRLHTNGTVDGTLVSGSSRDDFIRCLSQLPDGRIAVGGAFQSYAGAARSSWVVLDSQGALTPGNVDLRGSYVGAALWLPDARIVLVGSLWSAGGQPHLGLVRLEAGGTSVDASFTPHTTRPGSVNAIQRQPDGKALVMGNFTYIGGPPPTGLYRPSIFRIQADGSVDNGFDAGSGFHIPPQCAATGPGGRILVAGPFESVNGVLRKTVAALLPNGAVDPVFAPVGGPDGSVTTILADPDGRVTIGGWFLNFSGQPRPHFARLDTSGQLTADYQGLTVPNHGVLAGLRLPDGSFWAGGHFTTINGNPQQYLAKLQSNGTIDPSGTPALNGSVLKLAAQSGEAFFAGGTFTTASGSPRALVVKLTATGAVDSGFAPALATSTSAPSTFTAMAPDESGRLYVAGTWAGTLPNRILGLLRLRSDGSHDPTFDTGVAGGNVSAIAPIDGGLLVGGTFTEWNGQPRYGLVRLLVQPSLAAPVPPEDFTVIGGEGGISLSWNAVSGADGFLIERRNSSSSWQPIATLAAGTTGFLDTGLPPGSRWSYRILAFNAAGGSSATADFEAILPATFAGWKDAHGILAGTPADDDSDHDGIPLLIEYALDLSPAEADQAGLPVATLHSDRLEFHYLKARSDLLYAVETSTDLEHWSTEGVSQGSGSLHRVANIPRVEESTQFLRISVQVLQP